MRDRWWGGGLVEWRVGGVAGWWGGGLVGWRDGTYILSVSRSMVSIFITLIIILFILYFYILYFSTYILSVSRTVSSRSMVSSWGTNPTTVL